MVVKWWQIGHTGMGCQHYQHALTRTRLERPGLVQGHYFVDVGIYEQDWACAYDYHWHVYPLQITAAHQDNGTFSPPYSWEVCPLPSRAK